MNRYHTYHIQYTYSTRNCSDYPYFLFLGLNTDSIKYGPSFRVWKSKANTQGPQTCTVFNDPEAVTPLLAKWSLIVCKIMRKWLFFSFELLPQPTGSKLVYGLICYFQVFFSTARCSWHHVGDPCFRVWLCWDWQVATRAFTQFSIRSNQDILPSSNVSSKYGYVWLQRTSIFMSVMPK